MGLVHTPRVFASIAKGMMRQSNVKDKSSRIGIGLVEPHKYYARAGVLDYALGHLNNAAYFSHAEYARWEMGAVNGWMQAMMQDKSIYFVTAQSCRYRAEIRPFFREFEVQSIVSGMDDKNIWLYQTFRHAQEGDDRVRAQLIVKGVILKNREVIDPRAFLKDKVGVDPSIVDSFDRRNTDTGMERMVASFEALEEAKRGAAALDDRKITR